MTKSRLLNPDRFANLRRSAKADGLDITVELSPYETPKAVAGSVDDKNLELRIFFSYIDTEPGVEFAASNGVRFVEGKHTGKLLTIIAPLVKVPLDQETAEDVRQKIRNALKQRADSVKSKIGRQLNLDAASAVINEELGPIWYM